MKFKVLGNIIYIDAYFIPEDEVCPICGSKDLYKNGHTIKTIKHCTYYTSLFIVKCHIQNYKCKDCNHIFREKNTFANDNEQLSKETIFIILDKLKYYTATFESVARDLHLTRHNIISIFDRYVEYTPSSTLPEIMCFDEKHINKGLSDIAYSFVILDWKNIKIYDMLQSRHKKSLEKYFDKFSLEERLKVKYIIIDMWESYKDIAKRYFKNAKIAIDSFHVMEHINKAMNKIRIKVMQKFNLNTEQIDDNDPYYYVLKKYHYIFLQLFDDVKDFSKYNKKLKMWLNKYKLRKYMLDIDDELKLAYELSEEYREFNRAANENNCEEQLNDLIEKFFNSKLEPFIEVAKTLSTWKEYILNSFITIKDCLDDNGKARRLSNGPIEGINSMIEKINVNGNGYTNFERFKNRCIYVINKDYIIRGTPKKSKQYKKNKDKDKK